MAIDRITVRGARQHNLKNINVEIPRDRLTVITGLSGSGKSSLAFDTIYAEGQRRYVESLSAYARQFLDQLEKPGRRFGRRPLARHLHRAEDRLAQPALDRRHGHRGLRLPAPALLLHRPAALSHLRRADHAPVGRADRPQRAGASRGRARDDPRADRARPQGRVQEGAREAREGRLPARAYRRRAAFRSTRRSRSTSVATTPSRSSSTAC